MKHRVDSGAERLNQCNEFAKKLLASESPYIADIEKSQDQLRFVNLKKNENENKNKNLNKSINFII